MTELEQAISIYFGAIPAENLKAITSFFQYKPLKTGEFLLKKQERCDALSFVSSGLLRIYTVSEEGKEITQWISTKGYFVTDLASFIFESPARWNIQALAGAEVLSISKADYKKLAELVPQWNELEKLFLVRCFTTMEDRIYSHLSMPAEERYAAFFEQQKELFNAVPLQYIASMLGMTPETLSRIRKKQLA